MRKFNSKPFYFFFVRLADILFLITLISLIFKKEFLEIKNISSSYVMIGYWLAALYAIWLSVRIIFLSMRYVRKNSLLSVCIYDNKLELVRKGNTSDVIRFDEIEEITRVKPLFCRDNKGTNFLSFWLFTIYLKTTEGKEYEVDGYLFQTKKIYEHLPD